MADSESDKASKEDILKDETDLLAGINVKTTEEVEVPKLQIDQVLGQEHGVEVIRKASKQRRHVMLIGTPGTGKSMLASSMAELLPKEELQDILVYPNADDKNTPKVRVVPCGKGKEIVDAQKQEVRKRIQMRNTFIMFAFFLIVGVGMIYFLQDTDKDRSTFLFNNRRRGDAYCVPVDDAEGRSDDPEIARF